ncbi:hypothetical protein DEU56DRAFT_918637 [Suillus clintonianus]|uniref:uncharacterized protein n=1 Tax=Suillus clintonianus TaxID=1904413 RepID=UPI001B8797FC|nr:uncharacterized protein DEU56DRAFT_918637 [Suillus clintonianus]KAG2119346.1 hypothetical protein DEU56DRAFT_918637 [Suillus clintonianus]
MTVVSDDPSYWPTVNSSIFISYWIVAVAAVVVYDWVLTLGQEIELIWRQRWSLMTVLYLVIRYIGVPYIVIDILEYMPFVSITDAGVSGNITNLLIDWIDFVATAVLSVITIARLYAMYLGSRKVFIFLVVIFLAINITCGVVTGMALRYASAEEFILSGNSVCIGSNPGDFNLLVSIIWMLNAVWEVLALYLSAWIAVKHFRDLRRLGSSTGSTIKDCFTILIKSHALYFASFVGVSCFTLCLLIPNLWDPNSTGALIFNGVLQFFLVVQKFVLGPRLILSIREYHATLVADSDAGTGMGSIAFQERIYLSTSSTV